jgi:hypothetical protein
VLFAFRCACGHAQNWYAFPSNNTDLLAMQSLPEWPAANVLLRLFAKALSGPKVRRRTSCSAPSACAASAAFAAPPVVNSC